jgi:eukaryotic-like serine/threonine-protein kinase
MHSMVGRTFLGRFETVRVLGEGGMGRVFLANDIRLGRQVVVKVMHDQIANDVNFRSRFEREKEAMVRFQHPYVVTLHDASLDDPEGPCIVMEYIRGVTLDALLQRNDRLSAPRVGRLLNQLCEALFAAHQKGIVHRDLKPANLMVVDADSPYEILKVMDFGLAKLIGNIGRPLNKASVTNSDFAVGTPGYISPEQVRGDHMDHRSDLYSVGVILFELLTGRLPFTGAETMDVLLAHATEPPPTFEEVGAAQRVPAAVEAVVRQCLEKDPHDRPATARELAELYESALAQERILTETGPMPALPSEPTAGPNQPTPPPTALPPSLQVEQDPRTVSHYVQAWMPDTIATYKLRGFVQDAGGEVIESKPGRIRVHLGGKGCVYCSNSTGPLAWIGLGTKTPIHMELLLERSANQSNMLWINVRMRAAHGRGPLDDDFRNRCNQVYCDLRAYLMGQGVKAE